MKLKKSYPAAGLKQAGRLNDAGAIEVPGCCFIGPHLFTMLEQPICCSTAVH